VLPSPRLPGRTSAARTGAAASVLCHALLMTMTLALAVRSVPVPTSTPEPISSNALLQLPRMVFVRTPGPGGGGGGGGNRRPTPPSRAHGIGDDQVTLPVATPVTASEQPCDVTTATQRVVLDARPLASGTNVLFGLPDAPSSLPFSQGPGSGGGVGDGSGTGIGSGTGPGVGSGSGGGFGGGAYRLGSGVVPPALLKQVSPKYTADALKRGIQGTVGLEVVVGRDGVPIAIRVTMVIRLRRLPTI
jgi:protein TonB